MEWQFVEEALMKIEKGTDLNTLNSTYRVVLDNPPYLCKKYGYNSVGFKVRIGKNQNLDIPLNMLKTIYDHSIKIGGVYDSKVFWHLFSRQASDHGCHVHVVGQLFVKAGIAKLANGEYVLK